MKVDVKELEKVYKIGIFKRRITQAISEVTFSLDEGTILALVGQNGAGKTTLIKCILNLIKSDDGTITINDQLVQDFIKSRQVGYMPEKLDFPKMITLREYITDLMILRGWQPSEYEKQLQYYVDKFYLTKHMDKRLSEYSKGTMKKVAFIQAIIHKPKLIILDEPTDGLDPVSRRTLLKEILEIKKNKGIAIISTHILSDLAMIADEVIMLQDGRIVSRETIKNIKTSLDDWYLNEVYKSGGMDKL